MTHSEFMTNVCVFINIGHDSSIMRQGIMTHLSFFFVKNQKRHAELALWPNKSWYLPFAWIYDSFYQFRRPNILYNHVPCSYQGYQVQFSNGFPLHAKMCPHVITLNTVTLGLFCSLLLSFLRCTTRFMLASHMIIGITTLFEL